MTYARLKEWWSTRDRFERAFLPLFFSIFTVLASFFPYTGDDWSQRFPGFDVRYLLTFVLGNGRYVSNIAGLVIMRLGFASAIVIAAAVTVSLWLILDITENRTRSGYLVVAALFLAMPLPIWREAVAWHTGFSNYALGTLFMLVFLRFAKREFSELGPEERGPLAYIGIALLGLVSALFMEHITLYLIVAGAVLVTAYRVRFKRTSWPAVTWLLALLAGATMMFANPAYRRAMNGTSKYQSMRTDVSAAALKAVLSRLTDDLPRLTVAGNVVLNAAMVVLVLLLVGYAVGNSGGAGWQRRITGLFAACFAVVAGVVDGLWRLPLWSASRWGSTLATFVVKPKVRNLDALYATVFFAGLVIVGPRLIGDRKDRWTVWLAGASIAVLVAPLTLVTPIGPRCFYPVYLLMLVIASVIAKTVIVLAGKGLEVTMSSFFALALVLTMATSLLTYHAINVVENRRVAEIRAEVASGATSVVYARLPYPDYIHNADPMADFTQRTFKRFYGLPAGLAMVRAAK